MTAPTATGRVIRGFTVYADGTVVGPRGRVLKGHVTANGYLHVGRWGAGKKVQESVHRLVCEAFHGPPPTPSHHAAHWNGDKTDNRSANLRWASPAENCADRGRHGKTADGERHGRAKLTRPQVDAIRAEYAAGGVSQGELGRRYGVGKTTIYNIVHGRTWKE